MVPACVVSFVGGTKSSEFLPSSGWLNNLTLLTLWGLFLNAFTKSMGTLTDFMPLLQGFIILAFNNDSTQQHYLCNSALFKKDKMPDTFIMLHPSGMH